MRKVSAAIVTYNSYEKARETVRSLLLHTKGVDLTLYIVDNNSQDGGAAKLQKEFPSIHVLENKKNRGFGAGHNTVLPLLESDYHAVINPDILIDRDVLTELADFFDEHTDCGLVTPQIRNMDGSDQQLPKRDPTVLALVGRRIFQKALSEEVRAYQMLDADLTKPLDIEFATGCFFMMRTSLFCALQGFDTRFFIYYEDMDLTRRARQKMRAIYDPETYVYHAWERSSAHSLWYFLILVVGMVQYFHKWGWVWRRVKRKDHANGRREA